MPAPDLRALMPSWELTLRAAKKSPHTVDTYTENVALYLAWCDRTGHPHAVDHLTVTAYLADLCTDRSGSTGRAHLTAVRSFARWLAKEGESGPYDLAGVERPQIDEHVVQPFTSAELELLLKACDGRRLMDLRDKAIVRLLVDCGGRAKEIINMEVGDVDLRQGVALLHGKGARDRFVPLGPLTCEAIDRYVRARRKHPLAQEPRLWLGQRDDRFGYYALWKTLRRRAARVGVADVHPHRFRHTFADRWLERGGTEGGLMKIAGWRDPSMVGRYSAARAGRRALDEARRLNLGDL